MATKAATGKKRMTQSEVLNHFAEQTGMKRAQVKEFFEELSTLAAREVKRYAEPLARRRRTEDGRKGRELFRTIERHPESRHDEGRPQAYPHDFGRSGTEIRNESLAVIGKDCRKWV